MVVKKGQYDQNLKLQRIPRIQWFKKSQKYSSSIYHVTLSFHVSQPNYGSKIVIVVQSF